MYETHLTAVGRLITAVETWRFPDGTLKANFRVACNERRYDRGSDAWVDGDSLYLSVTCWRTLAENAHASLVAGDPVVVRGRLHTRQYDKDGRRNSVLELEASAVGADLTRCTAAITRTRRNGAVSGQAATERAPVTSGAGAQDPAQDPVQDAWRSGPLVDPGAEDAASAQSRLGRGGEVAVPQRTVEAGVGA